MIILDETIIVITPDERRLMETLVEGKSFLGIDFSQSKFLRPVLGFFGALKAGAVSLFGKLFRGKKEPVSAQAPLNVAADNAHDEMMTIVGKLDDGTITYTRAKTDLRQVVDKLYRTAFGLGVAAGQDIKPAPGAQVRLSSDQLKWIEDSVREEMERVDKLTADLQVARAGGAKLLRKFANKLRSLADAAKHVYYAGRVFGAPSGTVVDWISPLDRNTCAGCRFLAAYSPYLRETLPTSPKAGMTPCRRNCRCRIVLRQTAPGTLHIVQSRQKPRAWYIKMLEGIMAGKILRR